ncbi:hypothetical protein PFISCL1PPCAC_8486, partial [Pristionchus fissidentatus]
NLDFENNDFFQNIRGFSIPPTTVELVTQFGNAEPIKYLYATPDLTAKRELDMIPIVFGRIEEKNEEDETTILPEKEADVADNSAMAEHIAQYKETLRGNKRKSSLITASTPMK